MYRRYDKNTSNMGASMRPWHFSHGNCGKTAKLGAVITGFNEAVAFQPRKLGAVISAFTGTTCFNEAVAFQPRKFETARVGRIGLRQLQ